MSINSALEALQSVPGQLDQSLVAIQNDVMRSDVWKQQESERIRSEHTRHAEKALSALWGEFEPNADGTLSASGGEAWAEMARARVDLRKAVESAELAEAANPAFIPQVQSLVAMAGGDAKAFQDIYSKSSRQVKAALQDFAIAYLPQHQTGVSGMAWNRVVNQLSQEREDRLNTPAVRDAQARLDSVENEFRRAMAITQQIVGRFGETSGVLAAYANAVDVRETEYGGGSPFVPVQVVTTYAPRRIRGRMESDSQRRERLYGRGFQSPSAFNPEQYRQRVDESKGGY